MLAFRLLGLGLPLLLGAVAQNCNSTSQCPERAPCCSEYGFCGEGGTYCLGGCDPFGSYELESCSPNPMDGDEYDGDPEDYDWIINQGRLEQREEGVRLILTEEGGGTLLSSTRYVHYGTMDFVMRSSRWNGVISAAITMSDVKDEIDFEWAGANTTHVQTNHWFLGIVNGNDSEIQFERTPSDTADNFHKYTIDWQEEYLRWLIDGEEVRRLNKTDTEVDGVHRFPTTPSRIQISLWPGGSSDYANGTIEWAGGAINYEEADYLDQGYFWCTLQTVDVWCAAPAVSSDLAVEEVTGWVYTGNSTDGIPEVTTTDRDTVVSGARRTTSTSLWLASLAVPGVVALLVV